MRGAKFHAEGLLNLHGDHGFHYFLLRVPAVLVPLVEAVAAPTVLLQCKHPAQKKACRAEEEPRQPKEVSSLCKHCYLVKLVANAIACTVLCGAGKSA